MRAGGGTWSSLLRSAKQAEELHWKLGSVAQVGQPQLSQRLDKEVCGNRCEFAILTSHFSERLLRRETALVREVLRVEMTPEFQQCLPVSAQRQRDMQRSHSMPRGERVSLLPECGLDWLVEVAENSELALGQALDQRHRAVTHRRGNR